MSDLPIYNCHMHTFTARSLPRDFLQQYAGPFFGPLLGGLMRLNWVRRLFVRLARGAYPLITSDSLQRLAAMYSTGNLGSQAKIFEAIQTQYPDGTSFVVLAMNLRHLDLGPVDEPLDQQHEDLLKLAAQSQGCVIPFYAVDPREPGVVEAIRQNLAPDKFRGVKIYPNFGYLPDDPQLMQVYAICVERNVPVMTHCSAGGMYKYRFTYADRVHYSHPRNYQPVLKAFPGLRLCLAHFGGSEEWDKHLKSQTPSEGDDRAWVRWITDMIRSGDFPNLYTDISYLAFQLRPVSLHVDYVDYLKVLLADPLIRERVLYGSDYYAVQREPMTEKEASITLRSHLGEDLYFQIAHHNPRRYLGLQST